jgi:hypothetical protein
MSDRRGLPCCIPFCPRTVYRAEEDFSICPGHMMHVSEASYARWKVGDWDVFVQSAVIVEAVLGGLMHLADAGDEYRARMRLANKRKRETATA